MSEPTVTEALSIIDRIPDWTWPEGGVGISARPAWLAERIKIPRARVDVVLKFLRDGGYLDGNGGHYTFSGEGRKLAKAAVAGRFPAAPPSPTTHRGGLG